VHADLLPSQQPPLGRRGYRKPKYPSFFFAFFNNFAHGNPNWQMFRVWNALFLFLPLHRVTIYEWLGKLTAEEKALSWPMWPFRLWQMEICYVYLGAGFGKLASERWQDGLAMYHVSEKNKEKISGIKQSPLNLTTHTLFTSLGDSYH
jgi:hypothetical protein